MAGTRVATHRGWDVFEVWHGRRPSYTVKPSRELRRKWLNPSYPSHEFGSVGHAREWIDTHAPLTL